MRRGILGGTFDPPHNAHIALAHAALEELRLDEVMLIPVFRNPLKHSRRTPGKNRLEMIRLAIQNEPKLSVSDLEVERRGDSYAVDTLAELSLVRPGAYWFILGADSLKTIVEWRQPDKLLRMCRLAVALRDGVSREQLLIPLPAYVREAIDWIEMPRMDISASEIRQRIVAGRPISQWVNPDVLRYIEENKLYGS